MPGAGRTREPCVQKSVHLGARKQRQGSQNNRHSLRNGVNGCSVLSPVCRLVSHRRLARRVGPSGRHRQLAGLDPSVGGSGPHGLAVRIGTRSSFAPTRPSHPAANVRDDREAPLWIGAGRVE